jgi:hypothetical protein
MTRKQQQPSRRWKWQRQSVFLRPLWRMRLPMLLLQTAASLLRRNQRRSLLQLTQLQRSLLQMPQSCRLIQG